MEPFIADFTGKGHALNIVESVPAFMDALKKYCIANKCHPVKFVSASYEFIANPVKTMHTMRIDVGPGIPRKKFSYKKWIAEQGLTPLAAHLWNFGQTLNEDGDPVAHYA